MYLSCESRFSNLSLNATIIAFYFGSHQHTLTVSLHLTDLDEHSSTLRQSNLNWFSQLTPCSEGNVSTNKCTALVRVTSLQTHLHLQWCKNNSPAYKCKHNGSGIAKQELKSDSLYTRLDTGVHFIVTLSPPASYTWSERQVACRWQVNGQRRQCLGCRKTFCRSYQPAHCWALRCIRIIVALTLCERREQ